MKHQQSAVDEKKPGKRRFSSFVSSIIYSRAKSCTLQSLCDLENGDEHVKEVLSLIEQDKTDKH